MHIAVCDDNIADRKQTERLLSREADRWTKDGDTLYVEAFGNVQSLLRAPMQFDLFMIDMCHTNDVSAMTVVKNLRETGVTAPIILMCSEINYRTQDFTEDIMYIDKPLSTTELHDMLIAVKAELETIVPHIELRGEFDTYYVSEDEIIYAEESGYFTKITLTEGRSVEVRCSAFSFFEEIEHGHPSFVMTTARSIININHVLNIRFRNAYMSDGNKFSVHGTVLDYIKQYKQGEV